MKTREDIVKDFWVKAGYEDDDDKRYAVTALCELLSALIGTKRFYNI
jgi:hypothetical protein